jgi:hypothetical protein
MKFRWDQVIPDEKEASEPPPIWIYLVLFIAVECVALALTVATWPTGKPIAPKEFLRGVLLIGPVFWGAVCAFVYYGSTQPFSTRRADDCAGRGSTKAAPVSPCWTVWCSHQNLIWRNAC